MDHGRLGDNRESVPFLICRCGACFCALPLASVVETMRPLPCEPLAAMPPFLLGVSVIRGAPVPVVDAARLLGSTTPALVRRVVTLKVGERRVGLAVESVIGVRDILATALDDVAPLLREAGEETISAISTLDAQLLLVLQGARLVPDSVWQEIDSEAPPA
jgi:purine-binding chemotaxis protein CheW